MTSAQPLKEAFTQMGKPEARADFAVRRDRRPGRGLVHRPVLRAVLPADDSEGSTAKTANYIMAIALLLAMPFFTRLRRAL